MDVDKEEQKAINKRFKSIRNQGKYKGRGKEKQKSL